MPTLCSIYVLTSWYTLLQIYESYICICRLSAIWTHKEMVIYRNIETLSISTALPIPLSCINWHSYLLADYMPLHGRIPPFKLILNFHGHIFFARSLLAHFLTDSRSSEARLGDCAATAVEAAIWLKKNLPAHLTVCRPTILNFAHLGGSEALQRSC